MASRRITLQMVLSLPLGWSASPRAKPVDRLSQKILRLFRHPAAAEAVGARLGRRPHPETELTVALARLQQGRSNHPAIPEDVGEEPLRAALRARARDDFRAGRTLWFEGWLLTETEARLLRIAHLATTR